MISMRSIRQLLSRVRCKAIRQELRNSIGEINELSIID